jgi:hypothetical protein
VLQAHPKEAVPLAAGRFARGGAADETAMPNSATPRDRFEVRMSDELAQEFDEIQKATGLNGAEVFRRAIALYRIAKKASKDGEQVILRAKDRERELVSI